MKGFNKIIKEAIRRVLNEAGLSDIKTGESNDVILNEYDAIGFANKFYTLWKVIEKKYTKTFIYRKNISFNKEKAFGLYPDAVFDETLKGKTHSFTVSVASDGMTDYFTNGKANIDIQKGQPVEIDRFMVTRAGIKMSNYNKPYFSITGHDLAQSEYFDFIVNFFNKPEVMPHAGDILKVTGEIGFFNEKAGDIYINNGKIEIIDSAAQAGPESEEGRKFKKEPMVLSKIVSPLINYGAVQKNGFIVLTDENGEDFYVDTVVSNFRDNSVQVKFDVSDYQVGDKFAVNGTVQIKNGFKKLLRVKLEMIEATERGRKSNDGQPKQIKTMTCQEVIKQGKNVTSSKTYSFKLDDMDKFFDYVISYIDKYGAVIEGPNYNKVKTKEELAQSFEKIITRDVDFGGYDMWGVVIDIPQTKEKLNYNFRIYYRQDTNESISMKLHNIIVESIQKLL